MYGGFTVPTAGQEKEARALLDGALAKPAYGQPGGSWNGKGTHMWRLKNEKPEIFEQAERARLKYVEDVMAEKRKRPPGFETCSLNGWLYNKERNIYYNEDNRGLFWWDEERQERRPLHEGKTFALEVSCGAAAMPGAKTVVISDLHAAARALKVDLGHFDRPAAVLAIVANAPPQGSASSSGALASFSVPKGAQPLDVVAGALPKKLLARFAAFRGEWSEEELGHAVSSAVTDAESSLTATGSHPRAAVALIFGQQAVAAASAGMRVSLAAQPAQGGPVRQLAAAALVEGASAVEVGRGRLEEAGEALLVCLAMDHAAPEEALLNNLSPHLSQRRPRAASLTVLRGACAPASSAAGSAAGAGSVGGAGPLAAASARLGPRCDVSQTIAGDALAAPAAPANVPSAAKRPRVATEAAKTGGKVRLRQILLRHAGSKNAVDPVRRKPVKRSLEDAEAQILRIFDGLEADNFASFAAVCRSTSECQSSLKGGELAGDLGWVDVSAKVEKGKREALKVRLPEKVLRAAADLSVGELGDIVTSEEGAHIIQRTA